MADENHMRRLGIPGTGTVPWGAAIRTFYHSRADLLNLLVPYIKAGLEDGEFCLWITVPDISEKEAYHALKEPLPQVAHYMEAQQLDVVAYADLYLEDGVFSTDEFIRRVVTKTRKAQELGFNGCRVTGCPVWLESSDQWKRFQEFEHKVHDMVRSERFIVLCTYSAGQCGDEDHFAHVFKTHHYAILGSASQGWRLSTLE